MYMQIYMYVASEYFFQTPNGILSLNNWQYLGFVYNNQTGKYLSIFCLGFLPSLITIVHISLIYELMSIYTELAPPPLQLIMLSYISDLFTSICVEVCPLCTPSYAKESHL
jgi:hypothetical protein